MKKLTALLGLTAIAFHSNIFGGKPFAKLDEEQLNKIEDALGSAPDPQAAQQVENLTNEVTALTESAQNMQNAVAQALEVNGLALEEGQTAVDAIALLGTKCKEYGSAKTTHTIPQSDGRDDAGTSGALIDGIYDPNDEHNKHIFNK